MFGFETIGRAMRKGFQESRRQFFVRSTTPQQCPNIQHTVIIQTGFKGALRRHTNSVAGAAEGPAESGNDANRALMPRNLIVG